jgi:hypothetical protein
LPFCARRGKNGKVSRLSFQKLAFFLLSVKKPVFSIARTRKGGALRPNGDVKSTRRTANPRGGFEALFDSGMKIHCTKGREEDKFGVPSGFLWTSYHMMMNVCLPSGLV